MEARYVRQTELCHLGRRVSASVQYGRGLYNLLENKVISISMSVTRRNRSSVSATRTVRVSVIIASRANVGQRGATLPRGGRFLRREGSRLAPRDPARNMFMRCLGGNAVIDTMMDGGFPFNLYSFS